MAKLVRVVVSLIYKVWQWNGTAGYGELIIGVL